MPYGYTQQAWSALPQAERTAAMQSSSQQAGVSSPQQTAQANEKLRAEGRPGQYGGGGYQVLGGGGGGGGVASQLAGLLGGGSATPPQSAAAYVGQPGAGAAPPLGPLGKSTAGAGGGVMPGGVGAPPQQYGVMQTQQNPYIKQLMDLSVGQFNTPLNREDIRAKTRREQSLALNEARQMGGAGGRGGLWGSQLQQLQNQQMQALAGQETGFADKETEARRALLATMTGVAGAGTQDIATQLAAQQAANELNQRAAQAAQDYQFKYDDLRTRAALGQMSTISDLVRALA